MRDALGRLNAEIYPPFKEIGFDVRSEGPTPLPALIDAPRRGRVDADKQSSSQTAQAVVVQVKEDKKKK